MIYRLFYAQGSASEGVRVILEEIGAHYELIQSTKDRSKSRPPEQFKINPKGWIPVLILKIMACMNVLPLPCSCVTFILR